LDSAWWTASSGEHSQEDIHLRANLQSIHIHAKGLPFDHTRKLMSNLKCKRRAITFPMFSAKEGQEHLRPTYLTQDEFSSLCELLGTPDEIYVECQWRPANIPPDVQTLVAAYAGLAPVARLQTDHIYQVQPTTLATLQTLFTRLTTITIYQRDNVAVFDHARWRKPTNVSADASSRLPDDTIAHEEITMTPSNVKI